MSRTSLIMPSKCFEDNSIFFAYSFTFSSFAQSFWRSVVIPTIAFIGVRISCDIFDKKSVFARLAFSAASKACEVAFCAIFKFLLMFANSFKFFSWISLFFSSYFIFWFVSFIFEMLKDNPIIKNKIKASIIRAMNNTMRW